VKVRPVHVVIGLLAVALVVTVIVLRSGEEPRDIEPGGLAQEDLGPGVQSVVLAFGDRDALALVDERREIPVPDDKAGRAKRILEELARGPEERGAVATIPRGTVVRSVVFDESGGVFVDLSREVVANHPGGSAGELFTIRSLVRTLSVNFPEIETVRILVEGKEIETIAGHIDVSAPLSVDQYR